MNMRPMVRGSGANRTDSVPVDSSYVDRFPGLPVTMSRSLTRVKAT